MSCCRVRSLLALMVMLLIASSCTGSGGETVDPAETAVEATEVPATPTVEPAVEPTVAELSEADRVAAAVTAFDADPQPTDLIAFDHLGGSANGTTGLVVLQVCGWTGETVFDSVYDVTYRVNADDTGAGQAVFESATANAVDDCINTELVESALQFTRDYDTFWSAVLNDPTSFDRSAADQFWASNIGQEAIDPIDTLVEDGLSYQNYYFDGELPESSVTEVLGRSFDVDALDIFELASCREIPSGFGLYQGAVLVDDFSGDSPVGNDALFVYELTRSENEWRIAGGAERVWVDCPGSTQRWIELMNSISTTPVLWEALL